MDQKYIDEIKTLAKGAKASSMDKNLLLRKLPALISEVERLTAENAELKKSGIDSADIEQIKKALGESVENIIAEHNRIMRSAKEENATLKKALELACAEQAFRSCPCSEVDGCDTCPDEKQGDSEGATEEKRASCWKKYYIQQAQEQEGHDD